MQCTAATESTKAPESTRVACSSSSMDTTTVVLVNDYCWSLTTAGQQGIAQTAYQKYFISHVIITLCCNLLLLHVSCVVPRLLFLHLHLQFGFQSR
jgi:hypothetical protein